MHNELTEKISFRESFRKIRNILAYVHRTDRKYFPVVVIRCLTDTLKSVAAMIFSANILQLLYEAAPLEEMILPVVRLLAVPFGLSLITSVLNNEIIWPREKYIALVYDGDLAAKYQKMDYSLIDSPYVQKISDRISKASNWGCGIYDIFDRMNDIIYGICNLICYTIVAIPVLKSIVLSGNLWLYLGLVLLVLSLFLLTAAGRKANRVYQERLLSDIWEGVADSDKISRKYASFIWYWVRLCTSGDYHFIKDVHLYDGYDLMKKYTVENTWKSEEITGWAKELGKMSGKKGFIQGCSSGLTALAGYVISAAYGIMGKFAIGDVVKFAGSITNILAGFQDMGVQYGDLSLAARKAAATLDMLEVQDEMYKGKLPLEKRLDNRYEIEFRNVSFRYPGREEYALRNFSLKLRIGERMAIVGRNGSGKTTMIKLLCRLYDPQEGEILLNGVDIRKFRQEEYVKLFSVVFQDFTLLSLPLGQNVAASLDVDKDLALKCLQKAGLGERLKELPQGLDTYLYQDIMDEGVEISGGEAQKIALARALYKDASFVLLDEPTASLDPVSEYEIYSGFDSMVGDKTAIYISHRLSSCRFCDDIAVFHEGRLVQRGSHEELLKDEKGKYYELWYAQAQYYT